MVEVKEDEKTFFIMSCAMKKSHKITMRGIIDLMESVYRIPTKRCWYYLKKWCDLGFYDYGVSLDLGWFCPDKFPDRYKELLKPEKDQDGLKATCVYVDELSMEVKIDG